MIREATPGDAEAIQAIYAPYVAETAISFELEPPGVEEMRGRIKSVLKTHAWLVYEIDGQVAGYAYASKHRERESYQWSADVAVYVDPSFQRRGIGRALYVELLARLPKLGYVNAFAGIALPNDASIALHEAMGFEKIGVYRKVGFKLGEWRDVGWWQLRLLQDGQMPVPPEPIC